MQGAVGRAGDLTDKSRPAACIRSVARVVAPRTDRGFESSPLASLGTVEGATASRESRMIAGHVSSAVVRHGTVDDLTPVGASRTQSKTSSIARPSAGRASVGRRMQSPAVLRTPIVGVRTRFPCRRR